MRAGVLALAAAGLIASSLHASASPETAAAAADPAVASLRDALREVGAARFTAADYRPGPLRHIVLFRYRPGVTPAQRAEVIRRFLALRERCRRGGRPYIVTIEQGRQNSGEGAGGPYEQGFVVTFRSQGDRNYYVGRPIVQDAAYYDPEHEAFKAFVGPLLDRDGALVFDYVVAGGDACHGACRPDE
jgi:hypothetical protein